MLVLDPSMSNFSRVVFRRCKARPHQNRKRMKAVSATTLSSVLYRSIPTEAFNTDTEERCVRHIVTRNHHDARFGKRWTSCL